MRIVVLLLLSIACLTESAAQSTVYVSLAGDKQIAAYQLDHDSGNLTLKHKTDVSGGPGSLCIGPDDKLLFASIRAGGNLASFRIGDDGALSQISEVAAGADPSYVAVDRTGKFLLSAYYQAGKVQVHTIDTDGKLSATAVQSISTDEKAHAAVFDRSGKFLFVPHTGPNAIYQFRFDPLSGKLTANEPAKVIRPENTGPRHLWFHPTADYACGSDEQGNTITTYQFDTVTGRLSVLQTLSSLPDAGFDDRNSTSDIEVHPSGKFVYLANRGHDSISGYEIDPATGKLRYVSNVKTEKTPRSFNIDPSGEYLIAAGQNSATLATYKIQSDGTLQPVATTATGSKPWWVLIVPR